MAPQHHALRLVRKGIFLPLGITVDELGLRHVDSLEYWDLRQKVLIGSLRNSEQEESQPTMAKEVAPVLTWVEELPVLELDWAEELPVLELAWAEELPVLELARAQGQLVVTTQ